MVRVWLVGRTGATPVAVVVGGRVVDWGVLDVGEGIIEVVDSRLVLVVVGTGTTTTEEDEGVATGVEITVIVVFKTPIKY